VNAAAENRPSGEGRTADPIALAKGEVVELSVDDGLTGARLSTPSGRERFLIVLGGAPSTAPETPTASAHEYVVQSELPPARAWRTVTGCSVTKRAARPELEPSSPKAPTPPPQLGDERDFLVRSRGAAVSVRARVVAVRPNTVVWADVEPSTRLEDDFVRAFVDDFEAVILPRARAVFGHESDVDRDGRIALFFTPRTRDAAVAYFSGCDLSSTRECAGSNHAELLYLTPPHAIRPPYNTPRAIKEILAHELEHLIHQNQKVLGTELPSDPDAMYLLEGFGALAQDVTGYQSGNLYVTKAGLERIDELSSNAFLREGAGYDEERDGALRGGAYLFVRWLYDRAGGDEASADGTIVDRGGPTLLRQLLRAPRAVSATLPGVVGAPLSDIVLDFFTALALSGRSALGDMGPTNDCFTFAPPVRDPITHKPRGADLFAEFHGQRMTGPAVQSMHSADGSLRSGGVEILSLEATIGVPEAAFSVRIDPNARARLRVARIR